MPPPSQWMAMDVGISPLHFSSLIPRCRLVPLALLLSPSSLSLLSFVLLSSVWIQIFLLSSQGVLPVFTWSSVRTAASLDILDAWVEMVYPISISPSVILSTPIYACIRDEFLFLLSWRRQWHPSPVLLPVKSHGWRSLVGCSSWGR